MSERAYELRAQATRLRRIADELNIEADTIEQQMSDRPLLGGKALRDEAIRVLADAGQPMHYRELGTLVERVTNMKIRGVDPGATLLAGLDRDDRVMPIGSRTGIYGLVET